MDRLIKTWVRDWLVYLFTAGVFWYARFQFLWLRWGRPLWQRLRWSAAAAPTNYLEWVDASGAVTQKEAVGAVSIYSYKDANITYKVWSTGDRNGYEPMKENPFFVVAWGDMPLYLVNDERSYLVVGNRLDLQFCRYYMRRYGGGSSPTTDEVPKLRIMDRNFAQVAVDLTTHYVEMGMVDAGYEVKELE